MTRLPELRESPTVAAIYAAYEREAEQSGEWRRRHLGASLLGHECERYIWLTFRWAERPRHEGRLLRIFERGRREEAWVARDLRRAGLQVWTAAPETGEQFSVTFGSGHVAGSIDGVALGVHEAPKTPHVLEVKTSSARSQATLVREGLARARPRHWTQVQVYMLGLGLDRALYLSVCKDDDRIYVERVHLDRAKAEAAVARGERVVRAPEPAPRISEDHEWWQCRSCDLRATCQLGQVAQLARSCRTCVSATPVDGGAWRCELHERLLSLDEQRAGCESHLYVPALMPRSWRAIDASEERGARCVTYETPEGEVHDRGRELTEAAS